MGCEHAQEQGLMGFEKPSSMAAIGGTVAHSMDDTVLFWFMVAGVFNGTTYWCENHVLSLLNEADAFASGDGSQYRALTLFFRTGERCLSFLPRNFLRCS
jgi:hypothetical protein